MKSASYHDFIFSPKFRVRRHFAYWSFYITIWTLFWTFIQHSFWRNLLHMTLWLPVFMIYCYPLMYWIIPRFLLNKKYIQFIGIVLFWGIIGLCINYLFRVYIFIPVQEAMQYGNIARGGWQPASYLCMTTTAGSTSMIVLFKYWLKKQQDWILAEKGKIAAELQLLKAQVHPHFLFNTLNNIYSFSLSNSPKTPALILKLSSLLSYMLYDCKAEEVLLEKELEVMKNYTDLEKERYGNKLDISWNVEGNLMGRFIAPLLLLPLLENAFKHGTSELLEKPWLSFDLVVRRGVMKCKIVNSKNEFLPSSKMGIGIENVKKRLALIYQDNYELKMSDEENFYVVSLLIVLKNDQMQDVQFSTAVLPPVEKVSL